MARLGPDLYVNDLLRHLNVTTKLDLDEERLRAVEVSLSHLLETAKARGISVEEFWKLAGRFLCNILEHEETGRALGQSSGLSQDAWRRHAIVMSVQELDTGPPITSAEAALDLKPEPMRQTESTRAEPNVLDSGPGSGVRGLVQQQIDATGHKTTSGERATARQPTAAPQKKLLEVVHENPPLTWLAPPLTDGATAELATRTDASIARLNAKRGAQELPFGSEIHRITRDRESDPILDKLRRFRCWGSVSERLLDQGRSLEDPTAAGFSGGIPKQSEPAEPAAPLSVAPHAESLFQKKLREVLRESPELHLARTLADGTTADLETRADASLAKLKAKRAAQELPFGSLQSLKKRAMRPDVKESLLLPDRLLYIIDRIQILSEGSRENLLRRFGLDPDVEDEDELCWLLLWAAARDIDIDSEHFWEHVADEVAAVINHGVHREEEWKKLKAENQKLGNELRDTHSQISRLSFAQRLHKIVHSTWRSTVPSKPYDSTPSHQPTMQAESARTKHNVLEIAYGASGFVQEQIDRVGHGQLNKPTATNRETEEQMRAARRCAWMNERHPGWSPVDWSQHTGNDYKTLRKYRNGITTNRTPKIRGDISRAEKVAFSEVPE